MADYTNAKLGRLLSSTDETIRRNAMSILKCLQKHGLDTKEDDTIECPLCGEGVHHEQRNGVDVWVCDECPFYGFEFWTGKEFALLKEFDDVKQEWRSDNNPQGGYCPHCKSAEVVYHQYVEKGTYSCQGCGQSSRF